MKRKHRREHLRNKVSCWAARLRVRPVVVRVQGMTRKWGSCSTRGIITLAEDLADEEQGFQDFVIVHELLHLRVRNHGKLFKAFMGLHVPGWRRYEAARAARPESAITRKQLMTAISRTVTNCSADPLRTVRQNVAR
jgi:predicted metal-dependent hydrolase